MLEDLFSEIDVYILNDGSSTYIHPATSSTFALDLFIFGPSLAMSEICKRICAEVTPFLWS